MSRPGSVSKAEVEARLSAKGSLCILISQLLHANAIEKGDIGGNMALYYH